MNLLLEAGDVARVLNIVPATVRALARAGHLRVAAKTPRGVRLFRVADVEALRRQREACTSGQAGTSSGSLVESVKGGEARRR